MEFDGSQVLIGKGAQADVFRYQGYAYKVYRSSYPAEWIAFEKDQQKAVNGAGLCPVRYYDTDDDHIIKMDLIDGEALEKKVREGYIEGFGILAEAFRKIHAASVEGIRMPPLMATAGMGLTEEEKDTIFPIIEKLSGKYPSCICHLDMHFLNIMLPHGEKEEASQCSPAADHEETAGRTDPAFPEYVIIDWMNARIAPAVFDYARTYVIFDEFSREGLAIYKQVIADDIKNLGISDEDFHEAVKVCAIIRNREK
ncbi:MAG: aminoglycoside phosphotransferase family protein [Clostridiales bacterium]|nr:aminoglycoside phosphotransferase family protein [Clostridiales bacterium]